MRDGFINVSCVSPKMCVADTKFNTDEICKAIDVANQNNVNVVVFPELCITGSFCGDLYFSETLLSNAKTSIKLICDFTKDKYPIVIVGAPIKHNCRLYNCAIVICGGKIVAIIPKTYICPHSSKGEGRHFCSANSLKRDEIICFDDYSVPFGNNIVLKNAELDNYSFCVEVGEDIYSPVCQTEKNVLGGASIVVNLSAYNETVSTTEKLIDVVSALSYRLNCGYILTNASTGESTQDGVCGGGQVIAENGEVLCQKKPFDLSDSINSQIDVNKLSHIKSQYSYSQIDNIRFVNFEQKIIDTELTTKINSNPFIPNKTEFDAELVLNTQAYGLKKRLIHSKSKTAVIGISGGLDSTLALLVAVRAAKLCNMPLTDIIAVTMPCFGTSNRTKSNAVLLCEKLGVTLKEVNISGTVKSHFDDIGHDISTLDVTFENAQARERTQVLMDIANMYNGLVIGTGDLSELALGWATYNGDHMSMYGVNASIPKTMVRYLVNYESGKYNNEISKILLDIIDTPVSPELLPTDNSGGIAQITEDVVGPYELHDFFIYNTLKYGFGPKKVFRIATNAFNGVYDNATILKWLRIFIRRFFVQQFKRTCIPDGPKATEISLSPRTDWKMPTDASFNDWLNEVDEIYI